MTATFNVVAYHDPQDPTPLEFPIQAGCSLADMLGEGNALAYVNGIPVPRVYWPTVRPKADTVVTLRAVHAGGNGGKGILRLVAVAALTVASAGIAAAGIPALGIAGGSWAAAGVAAGVSVVGNLAINALIPPQRQNNPGFGDSPNRLPSLTNTRNQTRKFGVLPRVYGHYKNVPDTCVSPFTEVDGNDQYLRQGFCLGYGPLALKSDIKIGDTSISQYDDFEVQFRRGYPKATLVDRGDWGGNGGGFPQPSDLSFGDFYTASKGGNSRGLKYATGDTIVFNNLAAPSSADAWDVNGNKPAPFSLDSVTEAQQSVVTKNGQSTVRTTSPRTKQISLGLTAPTGLAVAEEDGSGLNRILVRFRIEYAPTGTTNWTTPDSLNATGVANDEGGGIFNANGKTNDTLRLGVSFAVPEGQYDVRLTRVETIANPYGDPHHADVDERGTFADVTWAALRSVTAQNGPAVTDDLPLGLIFVRIRATDQLNGALDQLNVETESMVPVYGGQQIGADRWEYAATSNCAYLYRDVFTGAANGRPQPVSKMDDERLLAWAHDCDASGRTFNAPIDPSTVFETASDIAATGRGAFGRRNGDISIVLDRPQDTRAQLFTAHNVWDFKGSRSFKHLPHALKVKYISPEAGWQEAQIIVYATGYDETTAERYEDLQLFGVTDAQLAKDLGEYHLRVIYLRPETFTFKTDAEWAAAPRGSLVGVQHDSIAVGGGSGRLDQVYTNTDGDASGVLLDNSVQIDSDRDYALRIRRPDGTQTYARVDRTPGETNVLMFALPISGIEAGDMWAFGELGKDTIDCIIKEIRPEEDDLYARITAVPYDARIYDPHEPIGDYDPGITLPQDPENQPPPAPRIDAVRSDAGVARKNDDGSLAWRVAVSVSPSSARVTTDLIEIQIKRADDPIYARHTAQDGMAYFDGFAPGDIFTVRARSGHRHNGDILYSSWVYRYNQTVLGRQPQKPTAVDVQRGTFEIKLSPRGGPPSATYEFWRGQPNIATADIESQATRLGQGQSYNDGDREPETTYGYYIRTVNAYGVSDWYTLAVTTKNEPDAILKNLSGQISDTELSDQLNDEIGKISGDGEGSVAEQIDKRADEIENELDQRADDLNNRLGDLRNDTTGIDLVIPPGGSPSINTQSLLRDRGLQDGFDADIQEEASKRAQALLDQKNELTTDISNTREQLESEDESLASAISSLAAGSGEQFDVATIWYYDDDLAGWTGGTMANGFLVPDNGESPFVVSPTGIGADGDSRRYVKARIKRHGSPTWTGELYWKNAGDGDWSGPATIDEPAFAANGVTTISWEDIPWSGTIDQIRVRLTEAESDTDGIDIDWLAIGRPTPGASTAALQRERSARIRDNQARVEDNETLAAQIRGDYDGDDPSQLSRGLIFEQRQVDISAREAISKRVDSVQSEVGDNAAAINSEEQTRADETSALSQRATGLESRIKAFRLKQEYGFETGEVGQQGAPEGWTISGDQSALSYANSFGESDYGSELAYGATSGTPGAWSATKRITLAKGGADLSLKVRTKVVSGHVYTLLTVYDASGEKIDQIASDEQSTDYQGVLSLTATMPDNAHFVDLSLRASAKQ